MSQYLQNLLLAGESLEEISNFIEQHSQICLPNCPLCLGFSRHHRDGIAPISSLITLLQNLARAEDLLDGVSDELHELEASLPADLEILRLTNEEVVNALQVQLALLDQEEDEDREINDELQLVELENLDLEGIMEMAFLTQRVLDAHVLREERRAVLEAQLGEQRADYGDLVELYLEQFGEEYRELYEIVGRLQDEVEEVQGLIDVYLEFYRRLRAEDDGMMDG